MADVFQVKVIKPKKLKVDVFRLELLNALRAEGRDVTKEYKKTTATWKRKPKFETLIGLTGKDASVFVGTDNEIYKFVDGGTKPHIIRARRVPRLRFRTGFSPKTTPGKIGSSGGRRFGPTVFPRAVRHPGSKPRRFSPTIQKRRKPKFTRRMVKAMQNASARAF